MMGLTKRQADLLSFIGGYLNEHGFAPTLEEMRSALNLGSKSGINRMLNGLQERGHIRRMPFRSRSVELCTSASPPDVLSFAALCTRTIPDLLELDGRVKAAIRHAYAARAAA